MSKTSFPKDKIKVVLLEGIHPITMEKFADFGYENVEILPKALPVTQKVIESTNLLAVGCFCIGTNQVDLNAAAKKGIAVFNSPYSNTRSVAELVLAEMVML